MEQETRDKSVREEYFSLEKHLQLKRKKLEEECDSIYLVMKTHYNLVMTREYTNKGVTYNISLQVPVGSSVDCQSRIIELLSKNIELSEIIDIQIAEQLL